MYVLLTFCASFHLSLWQDTEFCVKEVTRETVQEFIDSIAVSRAASAARFSHFEPAKKLPERADSRPGSAGSAGSTPRERTDSPPNDGLASLAGFNAGRELRMSQS